MNLFPEHPIQKDIKYQQFFNKSKEELQYPDEHDKLLHLACICHYTDGEYEKKTERVRQYLIESSNVPF